MSMQDLFYIYKTDSKGVKWFAYTLESTSSYSNVSIQVNKRVIIISLPINTVETVKNALPRVTQRYKTDFK